VTEENSQRRVTTLWNKNFICIIICNLLLCLSHFSINPLVASYTKYLNTSAQLTGFLTGMFFAVAFLIRPFAGPVMVKIDKRKLLIFVFGIGSVSSLGYALFHSVPAFIAFRFLSGVQYSLVGGLIMTLAADHLPEEKMASGMGIYGVGGALGNAVAPALGVELLNFGTRIKGEGFGFSLAFLFSAVILAAAVIPAAIIDPDRKTKEDIATAGAWYKNIFTVHALPTMILILLVMVPNSILNTYMIEFGKAQGISGISVFFTVFAVAMIVTRPISGYLVDRFGVEKIIIPVLVIYAAGLYIAGSSSSLGTLLLAAVLVAIGFGTAQPSIQAMCIQSVTPLKRGVASNTIYMGADLGLFTGPFLGAFIYEKYSYATMYKTTVLPIFIAIICFAAFLPIYKRRCSSLRAAGTKL